MTPETNVVISYLIVTGGSAIGAAQAGRMFQKKGKKNYANILYVLGGISLLLFVCILVQNFSVLTGHA